MSWLDQTSNHLAINELNINNQSEYVTLCQSDASIGDNINNITQSAPLNIDNRLNNTLNIANNLLPESNELPTFLFNFVKNFDGQDTVFFLIFAWDEGDKAFKKAFLYYKNNAFVQWDNTNNDLSYFDLYYPWIGDNNWKNENYTVVVVPSDIPYVAFTQDFSGGYYYDKWYLKGIIAANATGNLLTFPFNHEITGSYQQNFNGAVFKAISGAMTKYVLGRPEKMLNWNYKLENQFSFQVAQRIQTKQAETGMNLILKEKDKIYFLDADPIQITQEANLVWNVNVAGTEKI